MNGDWLMRSSIMGKRKPVNQGSGKRPKKQFTTASCVQRLHGTALASTPGKPPHASRTPRLGTRRFFRRAGCAADCWRHSSKTKPAKMSASHTSSKLQSQASLLPISSGSRSCRPDWWTYCTKRGIHSSHEQSCPGTHGHLQSDVGTRWL